MMKSILSRFFAEDVPKYVEELKWLEKHTSANSRPEFDEFYDRLNAANVASLSACRHVEEQIAGDDDLLQETQCRFREIIQPWFDQSWFMERAKNKPRGYPGDYETLNGVYDNAPRSRGLGGYLDLYFLNTPLAHAVRERLRAVQEFLRNAVERSRHPLQVINVACGPCREFANGFSGGRPFSVVLLDMDRQALGYADEHVVSAAPAGVSLKTVAYNALRMSSVENNIRQFGRSDLIYSIGLCDYVPDNYLIRILRGWRESLAADGTIYVAFKDCREYDSTGYAWHVDWHFIPRTEDDCRRLFEEAGYDMTQLQVTRSKSPVIMNFVCRCVSDADGHGDKDRTRVETRLAVG